MYEVFNGRGGRWWTNSECEAAFFASLPGFTVFAFHTPKKEC